MTLSRRWQHALTILLALMFAAVTTAPLTACGPTARQKIIKSTFVSTNALRDGFVEWDAHHQERIVAQAKSLVEAQAALAQYRRDREPVVHGFEGVYHAIAAAALANDDPKSLPALLAAAEQLRDALTKFKKLEESPDE